jgi:hypothetical protein
VLLVSWLCRFVYDTNMYLPMFARLALRGPPTGPMMMHPVLIPPAM